MKTLTLLHFLILITSFLFSIATLNAQDQGKLVTLQKGKIVTTDGNLIGFQMLRQTKDKFFYQNIKGEFIGIPKDNVNLINKRNGSHALVYGASSGASAMVGYLIGSALNQRSVSDKTKRNGFIVSAISGTLFGLIYGSTKKKYTTIYKSPALDKTLGQLKLKLTSPNEVSSLSLVYSF